MPDNQDLDRFLASVERSGLRMVQLATRNTDDAFDLVQDAMIKLVQKYANKPAEEWRPLFYRILQSRITDYHRKSSLTRRIFGWFDDEDEDRDSGVDTAGPAEVLAEQLTRENLVEGLNNLPARQQQVFPLRIWEGFNVAETANIMKCGEGSVKTHLSRAVAALKKAIADE